MNGALRMIFIFRWSWSLEVRLVGRALWRLIWSDVASGNSSLNLYFWVGGRN